MFQFAVITILITITILISIYIFKSHPGIPFSGGSIEDLEPFDNFQFFNDLESVESSKCQPFVVRPKQADLVAFIKPERFSCNSPLGQYASFSESSGILPISDNLITKRIEEGDKNFTCVYTEIVKTGYHPINGTLVSGDKREIPIEPGIPTKISFEQFVVYCRDPTGYHFYNKTFFNFLPKIEASDKDSDKESGNLIILSVSGMSHNQAMRQLRTSLEWAAEKSFLSFSMFDQVIIEDDISLWKNFSRIFSPKNCHFSFLHLTEITKNSDGKLINLDEILKFSLEELLEAGVLENTTVVIISDGGDIESEISKTESGSLESKYGLFLIRLSDNYRRKHPQKVEILKGNVDRLITNNNIAGTLEELVTDKVIKKDSLLSTRISQSVDCETAGISEKSCICSKSRDFDKEEQ